MVGNFNMKKIILLISAVLLITLCGCQIKEPNLNSSSNSTINSSQEQDSSIQQGPQDPFETSRIPI